MNKPIVSCVLFLSFTQPVFSMDWLSGAFSKLMCKPQSSLAQVISPDEILKQVSRLVHVPPSVCYVSPDQHYYITSIDLKEELGSNFEVYKFEETSPICQIRIENTNCLSHRWLDNMLEYKISSKNPSLNDKIILFDLEQKKEQKRYNDTIKNLFGFTDDMTAFSPSFKYMARASRAPDNQSTKIEIFETIIKNDGEITIDLNNPHMILPLKEYKYEMVDRNFIIFSNDEQYFIYHERFGVRVTIGNLKTKELFYFDADAKHPVQDSDDKDGCHVMMSSGDHYSFERSAWSFDNQLVLTKEKMSWDAQKKDDVYTTQIYLIHPLTKSMEKIANESNKIERIFWYQNYIIYQTHTTVNIMDITGKIIAKKEIAGSVKTSSYDDEVAKDKRNASAPTYELYNFDEFFKLYKENK